MSSLVPPDQDSCTYTLFEGNNQSLVFIENNGIISLSEQYLWKPGTRELLMAALPMRDAENANTNRFSRYFFQQDRGLNIVSAFRMDNGQMKTVSTMSYLGFGDNATYEPIKNINSSMAGANIEKSKDQELDGMLSASWGNVQGKTQYIEIELENEINISQLAIWTAEKFPKTFAIYVLPQGENSPNSGNIGTWLNNPEIAKKYLANIITNGRYQNKKKEDTLACPYKILLGDRKGDRIIIAWEQYDNAFVEVNEFEITKVPTNPGSIAFAGQWLDRETNMYYQINRYRLAGSDKFISPDPIGFLDGNNLYAYAKGNPLEWHDPDGRVAHIFWGALAGATINSGLYATQCWLTGDEFSWKTLAIKAGTGALSGAAAAATFGIVNPLLANAGFNATANIVMAATSAGFAGGFTGGFTDALLTQEGWDFANAGLAGLKTGGWGALGGGITGGIMSYTGASFLGTTLSGAMGGGITGGLQSGTEAFYATGDFSEALYAGINGTWKGATAGGVIAGASWGVGRASGMIKKLEGYPEHLPDPRQGIMIRTRSSAINRTYDGQPVKPGYARHHVKPLALGGRDVSSNLVNVPIGQHSAAVNPGNAHPGSFVNSQKMGTIFY